MIEIVSILSIMTMALAIFMLLYLFQIHASGTPGIKWLFAGVLCSLILRLLKFILFYYLDAKHVGVALGILGIASLGPFVWLLVRRYLQGTRPGATHLLLFLPALLAFFVIWPVLFVPSWWPFFFGTSFTLLLILASCQKAYKYREALQPGAVRWIQLLLIWVLIDCLFFMYELLFLSLLNNTIGSVVSIASLYFLFYYLIKHKPPFYHSARNPESESLARQIEAWIHGQRLYRQPALSLADVSQSLGVPAYSISRTINQEFGRSFPEFVNRFRVEEIKQRMLDPSFDYLKLEALAAETGFKTPSSFYAAFKKEVGTTPAQFRKQMR